MDHPIDKRTAKILFIEPLEARRSMVRNGLRDLGFQDVTQFSLIGDAVAHIEAQQEAPDWIITQLLPDQTANGISLLGLCTRHPVLFDTRVSIVLKEEQFEILPHAFEMGLFSSHRDVPDMAGFMRSLSEVFKTGEYYQWNDGLIAGSFLRKHLRKFRQYDDVVHLDMSLMSLYHDVPALVLDLAESLYKQGRPQAALMALVRATHLTGDLAMQAEQLHEHITQEVATGEDGPSFAEVHDLKRMVAIDPDEHSLNHLGEVAESMGIPMFKPFSDGKEAWEFLKGGEFKPDIIVMEWRVPGVNGSQLLQRLRRDGTDPYPLVVYSSLVKSRVDKILLREMGVCEVIDKPVDLKKLKQLLTAVIAEEKSPTESRNAERIVRQSLQSRRFNDAKALFDEVNEKQGFTESTKLELEAAMAFYQEKYEDASHLAIQAMQIGGQTLTLLNLLGKIYLKLRRFDEANRFFDKAQEISPNNVDRLSHMAESEAELGHAERAEKIISDAKKIDEDSLDVIEAEAKVALAGGDTDRATEIIQSAESVSSIVAFMNNRAIALVNDSRFKEAIDLYKRSLRTMKGMIELKTVVYYNLGLALIKMGDYHNSIEALKRASKSEAPLLQAKAKSLGQRAKEAMDNGVVLELRVESRGGTVNESEHVMKEDGVLPTATGISRGSMRLHLVFQSSQPLSDQVSVMVQTIPRFRNWY